MLHNNIIKTAPSTLTSVLINRTLLFQFLNIDIPISLYLYYIESDLKLLSSDNLQEYVFLLNLALLGLK